MISAALGFVSVMVMVEEPLSSIVLGLKLLDAVGGANAVNEADAAAPVPALAVVILPVLFEYVPEAVAVIGTITEQLPEAGITPPDRANELPPLVIVTVPPQVLVVGAAAVFFIFVEG